VKTPLELVADGTGSVAIGKVGDRAYYACLSGRVLAEVGLAFSRRFEDMLERASTVDCFIDASALQHYDMMARSSFFRVVLGNRRKFGQFVMVVRADTLFRLESAFGSSLGEPVELLTDVNEFEVRLLATAPFARRKLDPRNWVPSRFDAYPDR
jgi:hypothetical protein